MATQMIIRIEPELKDKVGRLARAEGKSTSEVVRELLEEYARNRDMEGYVDELLDRIGAKLLTRGATPAKLTRTLHEVRRRPG